MRIAPVPAFVLLAAVVAVGGGWWMFERTEAGRYQQTRQIMQSRSQIRLQMDVTYDTGPFSSEQYQFADIDGVSSARYSIASRSGTTVHISPPPRKTKDRASDVAILFGEAQQDGIWDLGDKPPRGNTTIHYRMFVSQLEANQFGQHGFSFTDPHYWATTGGHQFRIKLDRNKPVPDLVSLKSTVLVEPRYEKLVNDFRDFGSPAFKATIAAQQAKLRARNK